MSQFTETWVCWECSNAFPCMANVPKGCGAPNCLYGIEDEHFKLQDEFIEYEQDYWREYNC